MRAAPGRGSGTRAPAVHADRGDPRPRGPAPAVRSDRSAPEPGRRGSPDVAQAVPGGGPMTNAVIAARLQFAFTIMFHYLFPILTMGLGLLIALLKTIEHFGRRPEYGAAARFWARLFAITFAAGVVTGIPMEFQFGTNWARFSELAGPVVGQTLFMEGRS